ncbi:hypothetical protein [Streptomyces sp. NPDC005303]|uniref:hypothetical protein n=1 Tax=Streptomyces sp. NPDC005303 TaxID=3155713 RepID=UPI0033A37EDA
MLATHAAVSRASLATHDEFIRRAQSRTDVEALDLTAERLRHLGDAFTAAADRARATMDRYAHRDDADDAHPVREEDQRAHPPQEPGPHRGREAGH